MNSPDNGKTSDSASSLTSATERRLALSNDETIRLSPNPGDYLLLIRCTDPWSNSPGYTVCDFWEFRDRDNLLITNREEDYPATAEQMEEGGPCLWKILVGDRLTWVGWRPGSNGTEPKLVLLISCLSEGYVYGAPAEPSVDSTMSFGAPTSEPSEEIRRLWMVGYEAVLALGLPRSLQSLK